MTSYGYMAETLIYAAGAALSFRMLGIAGLFALPVFAAFAVASIEYDRQAERRAATRQALASSYLMLTIIKNIMRHSKIGMLQSLRSAGSTIGKYDAALSGLLDRICRRSALGEDAGNALCGAAGQDSRYAALGQLGQMLEGSDSMTAVREAYMNARMQARRSKEESLAAMQRYASVNMAVGTIVPSFVTFGFVGYSMMSSSRLAALAFAISFGAVLPFASKVVKSRMGEMRARV